MHPQTLAAAILDHAGERRERAKLLKLWYTIGLQESINVHKLKAAAAESSIGRSGKQAKQPTNGQ